MHGAPPGAIACHAAAAPVPGPGRRLRRAAVALGLAAALAPAAVEASCQTVYCRWFSAAHAGQQEIALQAKVRADPEDSQTWMQLLRYLTGKPGREAFLARYAALYDWEQQPVLEIDLEAQLRRERHHWLAAWKAADPESGEPWCVEAEWEKDPLDRVALLRRAADLLPDDARVHGCLATALAAAAQPREALATLEELRDRRPDDPEVWNTLVSTLRGRQDPEALQAALEERARRFPDDRHARRELLGYYDQQGLVAQRDLLLADLASSSDVESRWLACVSLRSRSSDGARGGCYAELLADFPPDSVPEEQQHLVDGARDGILMPAIHAGDWPALRRALAAWPAERLAEPWARIADWLDAEGCAAMLAAFRRGELAAALAGPQGQLQATRLGWALRGCGEAGLAEEVVRPFVAAASDAELTDLGGDAAARELRERTAPGEAERLRRLDNAQAGRPLGERFTDLLLWFAAAPGDPEPARRLSAASARENKGAEAVYWLQEAAARAPDDPDLRLEVGALALRFRRHEDSAAAARHVLAAPASARQHAEAHYLLGRVALREGRREEAATELLQYFPLRLRYAGCCGIWACDRGLQLLLLGNFDLPRLGAYVAERESAAGWFAEHLKRPAGDRSDGLPCLGEALPPAVDPPVAQACVGDASLSYLRAAAAGRPGDGELRRRLREVRRAPACPSGPPPFDVDALFDDDRLLSLARELTATD